MKWYWYIVFVLILIVAMETLPKVVDNKVTKNEIWWERYQIQDGSYVRIIHSHDCRNAKKTFVAWNVQCKMLDFYKEKIDVYDYCIGEDEANMLNYISKRNIKYAMERQWATAVDEEDYNACRWNDKIWDTTLRVYEVVYSMLQGELIAQDDNGEIVNGYLWEVISNRHR